jgi:hypothetical protein
MKAMNRFPNHCNNKRKTINQSDQTFHVRTIIPYASLLFVWERKKNDAKTGRDL